MWGVVVLSVLLPVVLIVWLVLAARRPAQVTVDVVGGALTVRLRGADVFFSLRRQVDVPVAAIERIEAQGRHTLPRPGLRWPGSFLPGVIRAGSYGTGADRTFWDIRTAESLLVITCAPGSEYRLIVVEVPDPAATARALRVALIP